MMLNLFIAVVLEGFSNTNRDFKSAITTEDYQHFLNKWLEYDPNATGWLKLDELVFFLCDLPFPFSKSISIELADEESLRLETDTNK